MNKKAYLQTKIRLRSFPFPFKAGLAICSDIDDCDLDGFVKIHRFLNSSHYGLGLPVADSFFAVSEDQAHLAYFNRDGSPRPEEAEFINQAIRDGLIDSLHAWGDFNAAPPDPVFLQKIAENLTSEFNKKNLRIPVWINHGSPNNRQNLSARLCSQYQGDNPASEYYTMPFIQKLGIKYYWDSEIVGWPLSLPDNHFIFKKLNRILRNSVKNWVKLAIGRSAYCRSTGQITQLARPVKMRDDNFLISFNRFSKGPTAHQTWEPSRHTLRFSLTEPVLDNLVNEQGFCILYTHLGKPFPRGEALFPPQDKKSLELLADYYHQGKIWVTTTSRLLDFWLIRQLLNWTVRLENDLIVIEPGLINHPLEGPRLPYVRELAGQNFLTPDPFKTVIRLNGKDLPAKIFPGDKNGSASIGFDTFTPNPQLVET